MRRRLERSAGDGFDGYSGYGAVVREKLVLENLPVSRDDVELQSEWTREGNAMKQPGEEAALGLLIGRPLRDSREHGGEASAACRDDHEIVIGREPPHLLGAAANDDRFAAPLFEVRHQGRHVEPHIDEDERLKDRTTERERVVSGDADIGKVSAELRLVPMIGSELYFRDRVAPMSATVFGRRLLRSLVRGAVRIEGDLDSVLSKKECMVKPRDTRANDANRGHGKSFMVQCQL